MKTLLEIGRSILFAMGILACVVLAILIFKFGWLIFAILWYILTA